MSIQAKDVRVEIGPIPKDRKKGVIYFSSFEEMSKVLTPSRVEILNAIKSENPKSVYELAKILDKDQANVLKDVRVLEDYGFLDVEKIKDGGRVSSKPNCDINNIELIIKVGAGFFGLAKDTLEGMSEEFRGEKLDKNKAYTRKELIRVLKPVKDVSKKIYDKLDK